MASRPGLHSQRMSELSCVLCAFASVGCLLDPRNTTDFTLGALGSFRTTHARSYARTHASRSYARTLASIVFISGNVAESNVASQRVTTGGSGRLEILTPRNKRKLKVSAIGRTFVPELACVACAVVQQADAAVGARWRTCVRALQILAVAVPPPAASAVRWTACARDRASVRPCARLARRVARASGEARARASVYACADLLDGKRLAEELRQRCEVLRENLNQIETDCGSKPKDQATLEVIMALGLEIAQVEQQIIDVEREAAAIANLMGDSADDSRAKKSSSGATTPPQPEESSGSSQVWLLKFAA